MSTAVHSFRLIDYLDLFRISNRYLSVTSISLLPAANCPVSEYNLWTALRYCYSEIYSGRYMGVYCETLQEPGQVPLRNGVP